MRASHALLGFASLALAAVAPHAMAQAKGQQGDPPGFNQLDKDNNGEITRAEARPTLTSPSASTRWMTTGTAR